MAKTKLYDAVDKVPLPPKEADILTTACDYCIVACGYKVYRWPTNMKNGGHKASQNAFGVDFPVSATQEWVAPLQHNVVTYRGRKHNVVVIPDKQAKVVNLGGDSSIRGGGMAQKCFNPSKMTKDRLLKPLMRINGRLTPVSWDYATDVAAEVAKHVIKKHGANAYSIKTFSYQYIENTYAITKYARRHVNTAAFTFHDTPSDVTSTPGFRDAGYDNFGAAYSDYASADSLMICGTDPYETKTIIYTQYIKPAIERGQKVVILNPRETAGIAYAKKFGAVHLDLFPGTDNIIVNAIARVIVEKGWQDQEWIDNWVATKWETDSGFGQGTRNTPWQWRTTWGKFESKGYKDWKKWLLKQDEYKLKNAAKIAGVSTAKIIKAAEYLAKPVKGVRPKTTIGIEKGFYWSNNTGNTEAIGALAALIGTGGRPGQMLSRFGGHQRGGQGGGKYPRNKSPEKVPGRRRRALDTDRWLVSGHTRLAHVIGTTWIQSMCGSSGLKSKFDELVTQNRYQIKSGMSKAEVIKTLKKRADSGGMVVFNQDLYLVDPVGSKYADIIFPASSWGEQDLMRANGERRLRLYSKFYDAPGEAKPDWWIISQLAKKMGFDGFDWENSNEVAEESSRFSRGSRKAFNMVKIDAHSKGLTLHERMRQMGTTGIQGPVKLINGKLKGTIRLHDTQRTLPDTGASKMNVIGKKMTHFNSQSGKVNMMKSPWSLFSDFWAWLKPRGNELWVTNGRINEKWQSGFDDVERRPYIKQRWPENFCEINPADAKKRGIKSGDKIMVYSKRVPAYKDTILGVKGDDYQFSSLLKNGHIELLKASVTGIAIVTPAIKKGVLYMDFLDKRQPSNSMQARVVDWISGNYNYKIGVGKIKRLGGSIYQKEQHSMSFKPRNITGA
jgi:arsenite oxidase large subunit